MRTSVTYFSANPRAVNQRTWMLRNWTSISIVTIFSTNLTQWLSKNRRPQSSPNRKRLSQNLWLNSAQTLQWWKKSQKRIWTNIIVKNNSTLKNWVTQMTTFKSGTRRSWSLAPRPSAQKCSSERRRRLKSPTTQEDGARPPPFRAWARSCRTSW